MGRGLIYSTNDHVKMHGLEVILFRIEVEVTDPVAKKIVKLIYEIHFVRQIFNIERMPNQNTPLEPGWKVEHKYFCNFTPAAILNAQLIGVRCIQHTVPQDTLKVQIPAGRCGGGAACAGNLLTKSVRRRAPPETVRSVQLTYIRCYTGLLP